MARKITFPNMGNYSIVFKALFENLGFEVVPPSKTSKISIEKGLRYSPEFVCFPFKVNMGNYIQSLRYGANTICMLDTQGECRFRYYGTLQQKILDDLGYDIGFFCFSAKNLLKQLKELGIFKIPFWRIIKAIWIAWQKLKLVELIEDLAWKTRPKELGKGKTNMIMSKCLNVLDRTNSVIRLGQLNREIKNAFGEIKVDQNKKPIKIGIIGEIYVMVESYVHKDLDVVLGNLGAEVHKALRVSTLIQHTLKPWQKKHIYHLVKPYLKSTVGGHGLDSVAYMLEYAEKDFDGVIHLAPFGCMPETTVRPILNKISKEKNLPFLSLSLDEHSSEAGLQTRLEAFIDLIKERRANLIKN